MSHRRRSDETPFRSPLLTCRIVRDLTKPHSAPLYWHVASLEIWWNPILLPFTDMSHRERSDEIPFYSPLLTCRIVRDLIKSHSAPLYWHVASWEIGWNPILPPFTDMSHRERSDETPFCSPLLTCRIVRDLMKPHYVSNCIRYHQTLNYSNEASYNDP